MARNLTDAHKKKLQQAQLNRHSIIVKTPQGIYWSYHEAERDTGIPRKTIEGRCKNPGVKWKDWNVIADPERMKPEETSLKRWIRLQGWDKESKEEANRNFDPEDYFKKAFEREDELLKNEPAMSSKKQRGKIRMWNREKREEQMELNRRLDREWEEYKRRQEENRQ